MSDGAAESQTSWRKHRWRSSRRRWRRMWRGRRKSGYGHTAVQQIIIGFSDNICYVSIPAVSLEEDELKTACRVQRQTETRPDTGRQNPAFTLDTLEFTFMFMWAESLNLQPEGHKFKSLSAPLQCPWPRLSPLRLTMTSDLLGVS